MKICQYCQRQNVVGTSNWSNFGRLSRCAGLSAIAGLSCYLFRLCLSNIFSHVYFRCQKFSYFQTHMERKAGKRSRFLKFFLFKYWATTSIAGLLVKMTIQPCSSAARCISQSSLARPHQSPTAEMLSDVTWDLQQSTKTQRAGNVGPRTVVGHFVYSAFHLCNGLGHSI